MKKPFLQDDALLADIEMASKERHQFHCWWLGQSGFLIQWQGKHLLLDPYLSDSLTKKYINTEKPHVRMIERVIDPALLDFIDIVTSSHNHTDHLDAETLCPLLHVNPHLELIIPEANRAFVSNRLKIAFNKPKGLREGECISLCGFEFHGIPAAHESLSKDDAGNPFYMGYVIRFGDWNIYHSGDTILYEGMKDHLKHWSLDLALLPINGRRAERNVAGNLWGKEAAQLAFDIGARMLIPCHYEMFEFNTQSPDEMISTCESLGQAFCILRAGERWSIPAETSQSPKNKASNPHC